MSQQNPLSAYFRAPKLQTRIPSGGKFYVPEQVEMPPTGELPVLAMTAKDELIMKNPDALLNGEAVANLIQSCVPCVKKPRELLANDVDVLLVAIQAATYGDNIEVTADNPNVAEDDEHRKVTAIVSARAALDTIGELEKAYEFTTEEGLKIQVRPLTYESTVKAGISSFQTTRSLESLQQIADDFDKIKAFSNSFKQIADLNFSLMVDAVASITTPEGVEVTDRKDIAEFLSDASASIGKEIEKLMEEVNSIGISHEVQFEPEEGEPFTAPVNFDPVGFFTASLLEANLNK
jgi:hypothetical protein